MRVNHVHSASTLTCTVRGRGPVQSGLAIIRVFTGIMLSRDGEVRAAASRREDEGPSASMAARLLSSSPPSSSSSSRAEM